MLIKAKGGTLLEVPGLMVDVNGPTCTMLKIQSNSLSVFRKYEVASNNNLAV